MNRVAPEMLQLHCLSSPGSNSVSGNCTDMTVLERQRARFHIQQQSNYFNGNELNNLFYNPLPDSQPGQVPGFPGMMIAAMKPDPDSENGFDLPAMGYGQLAAGGITRTASCPMTAAPVTPDIKARAVGFSPEKIGPAAGRESPKKRKADRLQMTKIVQEEISKEKRSKGSLEESESKITEQNNGKIINNNRETSGDTSKENSKASEVQKPDYIHVRARRGQATDSHSLAERVRREKISERMKYLQDLVPGCNKITGKAGMLDEIINYVQSLQRQVEFLSMKLATVNPRLDFNIEDLFAKEIFPACTEGIQALGISEAEMLHPAFNLQFNPACSGLEMGLSSQDLALRRTISAPVSVLDQPYIDASSYNQQIQPQLPAWDSELQNMYNVFSSQPFSGSIEACNLKMEM